MENAVAIDSCPDGEKDVAFAAVDKAGKRVALATFGPLDEIARNVRCDFLLPTATKTTIHMCVGGLIQRLIRNTQNRHALVRGTRIAAPQQTKGAAGMSVMVTTPVLGRRRSETRALHARRS